MTAPPDERGDRPRHGRTSGPGRLVAVVAGLALAAVTLAGLATLAGLVLDRDAGTGALSDPPQPDPPQADPPQADPPQADPPQADPHDAAGGGGEASSTLGASTEGFSVWEHNDDGTPVRWDPCSPVPIVLDPVQAPPTAAADLDEAVDRLSEATGLDLVVEGTTDERATGARPAYQPERYGERWAPVLVSWRAPGADGVRLRDTDRGIAVPIAVGPEGDRTYVTAQVTLNADRHDLAGGFDDRATSWGATLVHELAHVLGLGHVDDPDELLYVYPGEGPVAFGPGDQAGLAAVGAAHGCRDVPPARSVDIADPPG